MAEIIAVLVFMAMMSLGVLIKTMLTPKKVSLISMARRTDSHMEEKKEQGALDKLEDYLIKSGTGVSVSMFLIILAVSFIVIAFVIYYLTDSEVVAAIGGLAGLYLPRFVFDEIKKRNRDEFCNMFILFLQHVSGSIRSGMTLLNAIEDVKKTKILPMRIREEAALVLLDYEYSSNMYEAIMGMYNRTKSEDVRSLALSIKMAEQYSKGQAQMLESFTKSLIERQTKQAESRAKLSQNKMYALVIGAVPIGMGMYFTNSGYLDSLRAWGDGMGKYLIAFIYIWTIIIVLKMWNESNIEL